MKALRRVIAFLIKWDNKCVMSDLVRCAEHPYRSLFWRLSEVWITVWFTGFWIGQLTGVIHVTITS